MYTEWVRGYQRIAILLRECGVLEYCTPKGHVISPQDIILSVILVFTSAVTLTDHGPLIVILSRQFKGPGKWQHMDGDLD